MYWIILINPGYPHTQLAAYHARLTGGTSIQDGARDHQPLLGPGGVKANLLARRERRRKIPQLHLPNFQPGRPPPPLQALP